ncbi:MAG: DUF1801 domain-containing protein [Thermoplasmatales archaeon]|nr:MAG: DUF1801 domain-containing protein [Thermoplasmatales archaeon]
MDEKVDKYINKQKSPQKEICQKLRSIINKTYPGITEEMRGGIPCYGYTKKDPCGKYYIAALKDHVNLGFTLKGLTKKDQELLEGTGKTMKHIKVYSIEEMDEKKIVYLINSIKEK